MHINYEYILDFSRTHTGADGRCLDFGCGAAEVVAEGRRRGLDMYGADVFYGGSDVRGKVKALGLLGEIVREIENDRLNFPDDYFDVVVSNQVFEHVADLDQVLAEIQRVLKPGGVLLTLFPARDVWREGHCGIPFLHRFPKASRARVYYAWLLRRLGLGYHKGEKPPMRWAEDFCQWLDEYTFYRPRAEIRRGFQRYFARFEWIEIDYLRYRLLRSGGLPGRMRGLAELDWLQPLLAGLFRRAGGLVIKAVK